MITAALTQVPAVSLALTVLLLLLVPSLREESTVSVCTVLDPAVNSEHMSVYKNVNKWWKDVISSTVLKSKLRIGMSSTNVLDSAKAV